MSVLAIRCPITDYIYIYSPEKYDAKKFNDGSFTTKAKFKNTLYLMSNGEGHTLSEMYPKGMEAEQLAPIVIMPDTDPFDLSIDVKVKEDGVGSHFRVPIPFIMARKLDDIEGKYGYSIRVTNAIAVSFFETPESISYVMGVTALYVEPKSIEIDAPNFLRVEKNDGKMSEKVSIFNNTKVVVNCKHTHIDSLTHLTKIASPKKGMMSFKASIVESLVPSGTPLRMQDNGILEFDTLIVTSKSVPHFSKFVNTINGKYGIDVYSMAYLARTGKLEYNNAGVDADLTPFNTGVFDPFIYPSLSKDGSHKGVAVELGLHIMTASFLKIFGIPDEKIFQGPDGSPSKVVGYMDREIPKEDVIEFANALKPMLANVYRMMVGDKEFNMTHYAQLTRSTPDPSDGLDGMLVECLRDTMDVLTGG